MYNAIIARIHVTPIPSANTIARGLVNGYTVIVGKDTPDGSLGVYFPIDGQLSHDYCVANKLYKTDGGYIDDNRRVRTQRFMGVESEGLFMPLESLAFVWIKAGYGLIDACEKAIQFGHLKVNGRGEGFTFDSLFGVNICQRYIPRRNASLHTGDKPAKKGHRTASIEGFPQHFDTPQLRMSLSLIRVGDKLVFSEKCHGTSGRTGKVRVKRELGFFKRAVNWVATTIAQREVFATSEVNVYSGTRRCIVKTAKQITDGKVKVDEASKPYRVHVHNELANHLREGEVVYYEIVGFEGQGGRPIMAVHDVPKTWQKRLGSTQTYTYGCERNGTPWRPFMPREEAMAFRVLVYRITQDGRDLTNDEMTLRCRALGVETCPQILEYTYDGNSERLLEICKVLCDGGADRFRWTDIPNMTILGSHNRGVGMRDMSYLRNIAITSDLDNSHICEGVCVRVERATVEPSDHTDNFKWVRGANEFVTTLKYKGWLFCHLEDIRPNSDDNLDPDEFEAAAD